MKFFGGFICEHERSPEFGDTAAAPVVWGRKGSIPVAEEGPTLSSY